MKMKTISLISSITLGMIGTSLAGYDEKQINYLLNATLSQDSPVSSLTIKLYRHDGTPIDLGTLTHTLNSVIDTEGNLVFGSTGEFNKTKDVPKIAPDNIYVIEVSHENPNATIQKTQFGFKKTYLQNGANTGKVLHGYPVVIAQDKNSFSGAPGAVPDEVKQLISQPVYFVGLASEINEIGYGFSVNSPGQGRAIYLPVSFFAHLDEWGRETASYPLGNYSGAGTIDISATWE